MKMLMELFLAGLGTLGFSLLFNVDKKHLLTASLGGVITWSVYLFAVSLGADNLVASILAGIGAQIFAQIFARIRKTPAPVFCIPALVPLIPGSALYRTMKAVITRDMADFRKWGGTTLQIALGIAIGISFVAGVLTVLSAFSKRYKKN